MIFLILLILCLLLSLLFILFYFIFKVVSFANLYFWIIKISVPLSKIMEENVFSPPSLLENFSDLSPLFKQEVQKKFSPSEKWWKDTMLN